MAKLLTIGEARNADILWYESYATYHSDYGRLTGNGVHEKVERVGESGYAFEDARYYGISWRCWDRKPTEAQRKETAWQGDNPHGCWDCMNFDWKREACTIRWNNLDESYYNPDIDDRDLEEWCEHHEIDPDADPDCLK